MDFTNAPEPSCLLVDNGSLRADATRSLRRLAGALSARLGRPVEPVSLLHADRVDPAVLDGISAEILVPALQRRHAAGVRRFVVVPLFFGPSAALTEYIPERVRELAAELPGLDVRLAPPVAGADANAPDARLVRIVADHVRGTVELRRLHRPLVLLVDHGSPQRAVTRVRDQIVAQLATELVPREEARAVIACSMERRLESEFDFNEPLLERALREPPAGNGAGDIVLAPLFFSAGRHAGPGGDIETIARNAEARHSGLRVHLAPLVGDHPQLIDVLADRYAEVR